MINKFCFMFLIIFSFSCSQKTEDSEMKNNKKMENKTFYFIDYDYNKKCGFEIYINDILVQRYLKPVNIDNVITPINRYIINTGKQDVKIILYPLLGVDKIDSSVEFNLKVFFIDDYNNEILISPTQGKIIFDLPKVEVSEKELKKLVLTGQFTINNLPYNVIGWSKSKDLRQVYNIERQVREKFSLLKNDLDNRNSRQFITLLSKSINEAKKFYYLTDEQNESSIKGIEELLSQPNIKCESLDNTILKFYANGRLVTLETTDGKPALRLIQEENGVKSEDSFPVLFHISQDSDELEIIR